MKTCKKCNIQQKLSNFHKKKGGKFGVKASCKTCEKIRTSLFYKENKEYIDNRCKEYNKKNIKERVIYRKCWLEKNRDKTIRYCADRRAKKMELTPILTNNEKKQLEYIYKKSRSLTELTGIPHEVDHIKPLVKGGLHHPDNLQILTRSENRSKGDSWHL